MNLWICLANLTKDIKQVPAGDEITIKHYVTSLKQPHYWFIPLCYDWRLGQNMDKHSISCNKTRNLHQIDEAAC